MQPQKTAVGLNPLCNCKGPSDVATEDQSLCGETWRVGVDRWRTMTGSFPSLRDLVSLPKD